VPLWGSRGWDREASRTSLLGSVRTPASASLAARAAARPILHPAPHRLNPPTQPHPTPRARPQVLDDPKWPERWPFRPEDFLRYDEGDDAAFYSMPRFVYHIDDGAVAALTGCAVSLACCPRGRPGARTLVLAAALSHACRKHPPPPPPTPPHPTPPHPTPPHAPLPAPNPSYYGEVFPAPGRDDVAVLDICSSWVSHYPEGFTAGRVTGLGMVAEELKANKQLTDWVTHDLNKDPIMPFPDATFDVVTNCVSVDYLNRPLEVFKEIHRVLKPGGRAIMSFSNRCFPTKAIALWTATGDTGGHAARPTPLAWGRLMPCAGGLPAARCF
jgi:hypothetical protein